MRKFIYTLVILTFAVSLNAQWENTNGPGGGTTMCLKMSGTDIYAGTINGGAYISHNNGTNWTAINNGLNYNIVYDLLFVGGNIFAASWDGVFFSSNNGTSWTKKLSTGAVSSLAIIGTNIFASTYLTVYLSTNNGTNWTGAGDGAFLKIMSLGTTLYAVKSGGVSKTTNYGSNWYAVNNGLSSLFCTSITASGNNLFVGTGNGVFMSTNGGDIWTPANYGLTVTPEAIFAYNGNLFSGSPWGVYLSTNNGLNWIQKNQGFPYPNPEIRSLLVANNYVFAGTFVQTVWRRLYTETIGIQNISSEIPSSYSLEQNYPNPFNPVTKIRFSIPAVDSRVHGNDRVLLKVYDIMGREVQTLVNESLRPGTYEATFDAANLTSGIYFYRMQTSGYTETKRMTIVK